MPTAYVFTAYGDAGVQEFAEVELPTPGPSELLVRVRAAGVNPFDVKLRSGLFGRDRALPSLWGSEVSGVVEQVGVDGGSFQAGDEIFGLVAPGSGGFAEYALVSADLAAGMLTALSPTDAVTLPVAGATAWDAIADLGLAQGATVLINGISGGVGVMAAQLARDFGLTVLGTGSPTRQQLVESLGAILIDYSDGGAAARVRALVPDGPDGVLDLVGGDSLRSLAGAWTVTSSAPVPLVSTVDPAVAAELGGRFITRHRSAGVLDELANLVADGKLDPHVSDVVDFADAATAIAAVESGHAAGKVVLAMP
jgi:NADPH2:quinone reductase